MTLSVLLLLLQFVVLLLVLVLIVVDAAAVTMASPVVGFSLPYYRDDVCRRSNDGLPIVNRPFLS